MFGQFISEGPTEYVMIFSKEEKSAQDCERKEVFLVDILYWSNLAGRFELVDNRFIEKAGENIFPVR
jgi:hypothetical protein